METDRETIRQLFAEVEGIVASPRNQERKARAERYRRGSPDGPLITVDWGLPAMARYFGFDINQFYSNAETYLRYSLARLVFHHQHFDDDTVCGKGVGVHSYVANVLEPSLFGVAILTVPESNPWPSREGIVKNEEQIDSLELPDFYRSGPMPQIHRAYEEMRELVAKLADDSWSVGFPGWGKGIFGVATNLRGMEDLLVDMVANPRLVHKLMRFVTEALIHFERERAKFLGLPAGPLGFFGNDEVCGSLISPQQYEKYILPYEIEMSQRMGGITNWHSCGDTTRLLPLIRRIPNIGSFYTGPWTDLKAVMATFGGTGMPLRIAVNTVDDLLSATPAQMEAKLRYVLATCAGVPLNIRGGSLSFIHDYRHDIVQAQRWIATARRVAGK